MGTAQRRPVVGPAEEELKAEQLTEVHKCLEGDIGPCVDFKLKRQGTTFSSDRSINSNRGDRSPEHGLLEQVLRLPSDGIDLVEGSRVGTVGHVRKHDQAVRFQAWVFSLVPNLPG